METSPDTRSSLYAREEWHRCVSTVGTPQPNPDPRNRRRDCRYTVPLARATLTLAGAESAAIVEAQVVNVSANGLMLRVRHPVSPGTPVWVDIDIDGARGALVGRIVHMTQCLGGYKLGIQLEFPENIA